MEVELVIKHIIHIDGEFCLNNCEYLGGFSRHCQLYDKNLSLNIQCRPGRCKRCLYEVNEKGEVHS